MNCRINLRAAGLLVPLLILAGCKSNEQKQAEAAMRQLAEVGKQMGEAVGAAAGAGAAMGGVKATEPVDFRELKNLLPEDLSGMKRTSSEGQTSGAMGFTVSNAEARYESEEGSNIKVSITDMGAVAGVAAMATYAWALAEIDRETESGYERTMTMGGHRGYEKYDRESKSGEMSLLVAGRFVVEVEGYAVSVDALKDALGKVDVGKLEGMKNVGVK